MLNNYIQEIMIQGVLTDEDVEKARKEQMDILAELKKVKYSLDDLIEETKIK
jgi:DNA polymerase elongation subunit (family B)